jgi:hypothetical protein
LRNQRAFRDDRLARVRGELSFAKKEEKRLKPIIWNYGGGIQSVAIGLLISEAKLPTPERGVIANTGREKRTTFEYLAEHMQPELNKVGLTVEIAPHSLARVDLYDNQGSVLIPAFTKNGEGQLRTFCSGEWKRDVVSRWLRQPERGYGPKNPIIQWIGYSTNELGRISKDKQQWATTQWPLIMGYGIRMTRMECERYILSRGFPLPKKSRCWCCPFQSDTEWLDQQIHEPDEHALAVALDRKIAESDPREEGLFLHKSGRPLSAVTFESSDDSLPLFRQSQGCSGASCWT